MAQQIQDPSQILKNIPIGEKVRYIRRILPTRSIEAKKSPSPTPEFSENISTQQILTNVNQPIQKVEQAQKFYPVTISSKTQQSSLTILVPKNKQIFLQLSDPSGYQPALSTEVQGQDELQHYIESPILHIAMTSADFTSVPPRQPPLTPFSNSSNTHLQSQQITEIPSGSEDPTGTYRCQLI